MFARGSIWGEEERVEGGTCALGAKLFVGYNLRFDPLGAGPWMQGGERVIWPGGAMHDCGWSSDGQL